MENFSSTNSLSQCLKLKKTISINTAKKNKQNIREKLKCSNFFPLNKTNKKN